MAVKIHATYDGGLRCTATHEPSGTQLITDAPVDNMGQGASFSPTDLVPTALAACILTTMAISAEKRDIDLSGARADVEKHMVADPKRRIGQLPVTVTMPAGVPAEHRERLERAANTCPVHRSLGADVDAPISFVWPDE